MRLMRLCSVAALALAIAACGSPTSNKPSGGGGGGGGGSLKDHILGKWEATEKVMDKDVKIILEFTADKIKMKMGELEMPEASYKFVSDDEIEVTSKGPDGKEKTEKTKVAIKGDEMTFKGPDGKELKLKKAK